MEMINCEIYHCRMAAAACASRHLNANGSGPSPVGNYRVGTNDPNCKTCKLGMARAQTLGRKGVKEYKSLLAGIRQNAAKAGNHTEKLKIMEEMHMDEETITIDVETPVTDEQIITKTCKKCGETKPLQDGFFKNPACRDGYENRCKICKTASAKKARRDAAQKPAKGTHRDTSVTHYPGNSNLHNRVKEVEPSDTGRGDFNRLGALLSGRRRFDHDQLVEIKHLCERIGGAVETYLDLHEMFQGL